MRDESESDRAEVARAQARLVGALREDQAAIDGFDASRLRMTARILARKRARARRRGFVARWMARLLAMLRRRRAG